MSAKVTTAIESPRERLLATALRLFYLDGIQAVGVDRLVREADVTRATFYRHFEGKNDLIAAYIEAKDQQLRRQFQAAETMLTDPVDLIRAISVGITTDICGPQFRGCPFINAAAEHPDDGAVRRAIAAHRAWFRGVLERLYTEAGHADPAEAASRTCLLRDGAMVAGYLDDSATAVAALQRGIDELLGSL